MKKIFLLLGCALFLFSCNMNPSKEARIQKLETEVQQTTDKISKLENRLEMLEATNAGLRSKLLEIENKQK